MEDGIGRLTVKAIEEVVEKVKKDPRGKYCHIKGCKKRGDFILLPGNQLLCVDHEPSRAVGAKGGIYIPDNFFEWKDEEEWKTV